MGLGVERVDRSGGDRWDDLWLEVELLPADLAKELRLGLGVARVGGLGVERGAG